MALSRRSARRRLTWAQVNTGAIAVGASAHAVNMDLLSSFRAAGGVTTGATIMRTHLRMWPTTAVTAGDVIMLGLIMTGSNQVSTSFALGAGFDNPSDFPYLDWMLVDFAQARPSFGRTGPNNELDIDVRSRRKMADLNDTLLLSVVDVNATTAPSWWVEGRVLLALP